MTLPDHLPAVVAGALTALAVVALVPRLPVGVPVGQPAQVPGQPGQRHGAVAGAGGGGAGEAGAGGAHRMLSPPVLLPAAAALLAWWCGAGVLAAGSCGTLLALLLRGRAARQQRRALEAEQALVLEACGVLVDEVRSGRHPVEALATAGDIDGWFARAHRAAVAGTDVPTVLRASPRGAHRAVAAAWQVAEQQGAGLAPALGRVVAQLRADRATARVVAAELASARATSRLLVALPAVALVGATLTGGRPWEFLLGPGAGQFCLVLGLLCGGLGLRWIDAIGDSVAGAGR